MKILLIPNPILEEGRPDSYVPLGLLSLATVLHQDGFDVEILDINSISSNPTFRDVPAAIIERNPDVVGFSAWCNSYFDLIKFAGIVKEQRPHVKILFGGVQASNVDTETIEVFPQVDVVVRGECDHTIGRIIRSLDDPNALLKVPGLTFRNAGQIVRTPDSHPVADLNSLPLPDYSLFPSVGSLDHVSIDAGRGCPFTCSYCVSNKMAEGRFRQRSVESVIKIVKQVVADFDAKKLRFEHDLLTLNRKWVLELCDALIQEKLVKPWSCFSRIDTVDDEILSRMAAAGCDQIFYGVETGSPRMQRVLNKRLKLERALEVVRKTCELGIRATCGFIVGFPQERSEDLAQTLRLMLELHFAGDREEISLYLRLLVPFPGSPLYEKNGKSLALDQHLSDFSVYPSNPVDMEFIKKYPQVFSTLYHYIPEHLDREFFVRVTYLMINLLFMRYTSFLLLRDVKLGFPESLLDRIADLELPSDNIFNHQGDPLSLLAVSAFVRQVVNELGFETHPVHDFIKFDLAWHAVGTAEIPYEQMRVEEFSHDVMGFIKEAKAGRFRYLPEIGNETPCSVLFRKHGRRDVQAVKLPEVFREKFKSSGLLQKTAG
ncbi:MAG: B12-binding domain-containing radical SAM protein [Desulfomonilaceae bacterium]